MAAWELEMIKIAVTLANGTVSEFTADAPDMPWETRMYPGTVNDDRRYAVSQGTQVLLDSVYCVADSLDG